MPNITQIKSWLKIRGRSQLYIVVGHFDGEEVITKVVESIYKERAAEVFETSLQRQFSSDKEVYIDSVMNLDDCVANRISPADLSDAGEFPQSIIYSEPTETIRTHPSNHMLCFKHGSSGWIVDTSGTSEEIAILATALLHRYHDLKFGPGEKLANRINEVLHDEHQLKQIFAKVGVKL